MDTNQPDSAPQPDANWAENPEASESNGGEQDTFDRAYVEKLRAENAKYRTKAKELEPLAEKMRELEESKKTDLEKAQDRIKQLEDEAKAFKTAALRAQVAAKTGVPEDLLPVGGDEETLTRAAKSLVEWASKNKPEVKNLPGSRAAGANAQANDRDAIARQILGI